MVPIGKQLLLSVPGSKRVTTMSILQHILVYITVALAFGYLVKKFLLPKSLFAGKKRSSKTCGDGDCGCH